MKVYNECFVFRGVFREKQCEMRKVYSRPMREERVLFLYQNKCFIASIPPHRRVKKIYRLKGAELIVLREVSLVA